MDNPGNPFGAGRPSLYRSEYCEQLIEHMGQGFSYTSFAGKIRVSKNTTFNWEKDFPQWVEAREIGEALCLYFWEQQTIEGLYNVTEYEDGKPLKSKAINATVLTLNMKNRHGWRDKAPGEEDKTVTHKGEVKISKVDLTDRIKQVKGKEGQD